MGALDGSEWDTRLTFPSSHLPSFPLIKKGKSNLTDADRAADRQTPMGEWLKEGGREGWVSWMGGRGPDERGRYPLPFCALEHAINRRRRLNKCAYAYGTMKMCRVRADRGRGIKAVLYCFCKMTTEPHLTVTRFHLMDTPIPSLPRGF